MPRISWKPGRLAKNTAWMTAGQAARILVQALYFVLIARLLGADGYGAISGVVALATVLASFSGFGMGHILIKNVARAPQRFPLYWGATLLAVGLSGLLLAGVCVILARWIALPIIPIPVVVSVAVADLLFSPLVLVCAQAFQAFQRLAETALLLLTLALCRLAAAAGLWVFIPAPTPEDWAAFYVAASAFAALLSVFHVWHRLGKAQAARIEHLHECREGIAFSLSTAAQQANNDLDKTLLVRLDTLQAAGVYSAAFRLVEAAYMPIAALLGAAYARFFQQGARGVRAGLRFAVGLLGPALGYAVIAAIAINLAAPLIPHILGHAYEEVVSVMRLLSALPLINALYAFAAQVLSGSGHQGLRGIVDWAATILSLALNLWWIPLYSYHGSVYAVLTSKGFAAACVWYLSLRLNDRPGG